MTNDSPAKIRLAGNLLEVISQESKASSFGPLIKALEGFGLANQQVVDILKHPLCRGAVEQAVLKCLGRGAGRDFSSRWEFVRWAKENRQPWDLATPLALPSAKRAE